MKKVHILKYLLCVTVLSTSISASAGVIGLLSWDESSPYIYDSSNASVTYVQLGLLKSYNYHQMIDLTAPGGEWDGYSLATQSDAYAFVSSALSVGSAYTGDDKISNVAHEWTATTVEPFADGVLGNNYDNKRDFFFFESNFQNRLGLVEFDSNEQTIKLTEANNTYWDSNNYSKTVTSKESAWVSYLLVKNSEKAPSDSDSIEDRELSEPESTDNGSKELDSPDEMIVLAVPEPSTFFLLALGLLGIFYKSMGRGAV